MMTYRKRNHKTCIEKHHFFGSFTRAKQIKPIDNKLIEVSKSISLMTFKTKVPTPAPNATDVKISLIVLFTSIPPIIILSYKGSFDYSNDSDLASNLLYF